MPELINFSLKDSLKAILYGDFIGYKDVEPYQPMFAQIKQRCIDAGYLKYSRQDDSSDVGRLDDSYYRLVRFKKQVEALKSFNQGVLEADWYYRYSIMLSNAIGKSH